MPQLTRFNDTEIIIKLSWNLNQNEQMRFKTFWCRLADLADWCDKLNVRFNRDA